MVQLKNKDEIGKIAAAGKIVAEVLEAMAELVRPGVSTWDLDKAARRIIETAGAVPSFLGYGNPPFPAAICTSIDREVVHGIPDPDRVLQEGSIISIDVGAYVDGFHADAARTFKVGGVAPEVDKLLEITEKCFWQAFSLARQGGRTGDLSHAVQVCAESNGYGVVRELTGHGLGRRLHEEPDLPNYGRPGHGHRLELGMVLAMEPMINLGSRHVMMQDDGWTIITCDGKPSAHYENTFAITAEGPVILTKI